MNQIANLIDHHYEQTGIRFSFASKQDQVSALDGYGPYAIRVDVERTTFFAPGFSFNYRGATVSGALRRVPAGYVKGHGRQHSALSRKKGGHELQHDPDARG